MNIHHLKYFCETARLMNMSEAARKLRVSQSAVSRAIQSLETELGSKLLIHQKRHLQITEAGQETLRLAEDIFNAVENLIQSVQDYEKDLRGPLKLACSDSLAATVLPKVIDQFLSRHPLVSPDIKLGGSDEVKKTILDQRSDIGIIVDQGVLKDFDKKLLFQSKFCVVRSPELRLKSAHDRLIIARQTKESFSYAYMKEASKGAKEEVKPFLLLPSWQVCKSYALSGVGQVILPEFMVKEEINSGTLIKVKTKIKMRNLKLCVITKKGRKIPRNCIPLIDLICQATC